MSFKTPNEKIGCVLTHIKDQYELSPKGTTTLRSDYYVEHRPTGEIRIPSETLCGECGITFLELQKILSKLREDGLIMSFEMISEYA
jgi:hypothetical protein